MSASDGMSCIAVSEMVAAADSLAAVADDMVGSTDTAEERSSNLASISASANISAGTPLSSALVTCGSGAIDSSLGPGACDPLSIPRASAPGSGSVEA